MKFRVTGADATTGGDLTIIVDAADASAAERAVAGKILVSDVSPMASLPPSNPQLPFGPRPSKRFSILIAVAIATVIAISTVGTVLYRMHAKAEAADGDRSVYELYFKVYSDITHSVPVDSINLDRATADAAANARKDWGNPTVRIKIEDVSMDYYLVSQAQSADGEESAIKEMQDDLSEAKKLIDAE